MTSTPALFAPLSLGPLTLPNRIMISPMCQYSARDGLPGAWHPAHLGSLAMSGAGLLCLEATAVAPEGRISPHCLGLWNNEQAQALRLLVDGLRAISAMPLAVQLAHAGRKACSRAPWEGGTLIEVADGGWPRIAPSALAHGPNESAPREMSPQDIRQLTVDFASAARRAREAGFDAIEVHMAHGYLMHQFLSPLANLRSDAYGGALDNRLRLPLEVFAAVRDAAGPDMAVGARLSATDWADGGWDLAQTQVLAQRLQAAGCDFLDVSSGGLAYRQQIPIGPGFQVPLAEGVKRVVSIPVITVGLITTPRQAEDILLQGRADAVALARGFLLDPRWPWRAAAELGATVSVPPQLWRSLPQSHPAIFDRALPTRR